MPLTENRCYVEGEIGKRPLRRVPFLDILSNSSLASVNPFQLRIFVVVVVLDTILELRT